jgi:uncharacterized membrane protein
MMGFNGILGILLIAIILWAVVKFNTKNRSNNTDMLSRHEPSADNEGVLDILKKRFARGEISQSEYERMKKEL